jgi:2-amino-4-hydroxy-6-hydroxymethyldihydropteridine diphosphokinase
MKNTIYLGLGSNIGNRFSNIVYALSFLQSSLFIDIKKISSFYETSSVGHKQRNFYNVVIKARASLEPNNLLLFVKRIEYVVGRRNTIKWGPRVIDIDILFFDKEVINQINLTVPHKEIQNRLFVLVPLCEIVGSFIHPVLNQKISSILRSKLLILRYQKIRVLESS